MKKFPFLVLVALACPLEAAEVQRLWLGVHASHYRYEGEPALGIGADQVSASGLQFGYQPGPRWSLRGWWESGDVSSERFRTPKLELGLVSLRLHSLRPRLRPWLGLGIGELTLEAENGNAASDTMVGPEAGIDWLFRDNWSLGLGARGLYSDSYGEWDGAVFVTFEFSLRLGHNHLPRVQAFREARDGNASPAALPPPHRCMLQPDQHSPRGRLMPIPVAACGDSGLYSP